MAQNATLKYLVWCADGLDMKKSIKMSGTIILIFVLAVLFQNCAQTSSPGTQNDTANVVGGAPTLSEDGPTPTPKACKSLDDRWSSKTAGPHVSISGISANTLRWENTTTGYGCQLNFTRHENALSFNSISCDSINPPFPLDLSQIPGLYHAPGSCDVTKWEIAPPNEGSSTQEPYCFTPTVWSVDFSCNSIKFTGPSHIQYGGNPNGGGFGPQEGPEITYLFE